MSDQQIVFDDGATYDRYMGRWSRIVGDVFLDWLAPGRGLRWLDVGCGNGAFTEMLFERCAPAAIDGVDPSEAQLAFARAQPAAKLAKFHQGDAMALPFPDDAFDAAVMPLVIFFVPDPAKGVAEMARVVRAGGIVAAYGWDLTGGGFPYTALQQEMRELGVTHGMPPSPRRRASTSCRSCGRARGCSRSRRARSKSSGLSTTSRTGGRRFSPDRASARSSRPWRPTFARP